MSLLRHVLFITLFGLCLNAPLQAADAPSRTDVQNSLDALADRKLPEA